ncbi:MAG: redox-regulated ATPase YchF [Candidatus Cloacimonetes bacterium]|nr:redox-regulated ATPase YchF [Candidatus Cloacimonadota bacterium]
MTISSYFLKIEIMIKIGLVGTPKSGKTTVFNTITKSDAEVSDYFSENLRPNLGIVNVADERLDYLAEKFNRTKTIYATIEYLDFVGIKKDEAKKELFSSQFLGTLRTVDALGLVVRKFNLPGIATNPILEIETIETEFIFSDLIICEKKLETINKNLKHGLKSSESEKKLIEKCYTFLSEGKMLKFLNLKKEELHMLRGFQFLTLKSIFIILNVSEEIFGQNKDLIESISEKFDVVEIAGKFEMELNQLDEDDAREFMSEMNIKESAVKKLTRISYESLNLLSFFTIGKEEVRAWSLQNGSTAHDAAGTVHTDFAQKFIRAERYSFADFKKYGSEKELKSAGKFFIEGKNYIVKDGDIIYIRHS